MAEQTDVQVAIALVQAGDYQAGSDQLVALYRTEQSWEVNRWLVAALLGLEQYHEAYQYAREFSDQYVEIATEVDFNHYLDVLLEVQDFITARQALLARAKTDQVAPTDGLAKIEAAEASYRTDQAHRLESLRRSTYHLADQPLAQQGQQLLEAKELPLADYQFVGTALLKDPFAHSILKTDVLNEFRRLGLTEPVVVEKGSLGQMTVIPEDLTSPTDDPEAAQVMVALQAQTETLDPSMLALVGQQLALHLAILYPFDETMLTDAEAWVANTLAEVGLGEAVAEPDAQRQAREMIAQEVLKLG